MSAAPCPNCGKDVRCGALTNKGKSSSSSVDCWCMHTEGAKLAVPKQGDAVSCLCSDCLALAKQGKLSI